MDKYDSIAQSAWEAILQAVKKMKSEGMTLDEIAKRLGAKNRALVGEWINENRVAVNAPFPHMLRYLDAIGSSIYDFVEQPCPTIKHIGANALAKKVHGDDLKYIPVHSHAGAGQTSDFFVADPETELPVLKEFFAPGIRALRVTGDSMEPTISKNSFIGVIPIQGRMLQEGGVYLVRDDDFGLMVKRVRKGSKRQLMLHSDNTTYEPIPINRNSEEDVIVGEVLWVWQKV